MKLASKEKQNHVTKSIKELNEKILETKKKMRNISNSGLSSEEKTNYINEEQEKINLLEAERNELELLRRNYQTENDNNGKTVNVGTKITVQFGNDIPETFIISPKSKSSEGIISPKGDLGKALLGQQAGYECEFKGQTLKLLSVEPI